MNGHTLMAPLGGEIYQEVFDRQGNRIMLTYNDLWMLLVCRTSMNGDWVKARQAAGTVTDAANKRALAEHLWELEQLLGGLPEIPEGVQNLHNQRAHNWFNSRPVIKERQW